MVRPVLKVLGALLAGLVLLLLVLLLGMRAKSPVVLRAVRRFNQRFANPRQLRTAGRPGAYAGIVRHVGRRSGSVHETPVQPFPTAEGFVIALPYGSTSDWVRNVLAAGSATIVEEGRTYEVDRPQLVPVSEVVDALPKSEQRTLRLFRVEQALRVHRADPGEDAGR